MSLFKIFGKILFLFSMFTLMVNVFLSPIVVMGQNAIGQNLSDVVGFTACNVSGSAASNGAKLQECVGSILNFALTLAGLVSIVALGVEAFQYFNPEVSTDTTKQSIEHIRNIFIGLMLIAGPVMILRTFNIALTDFSFLGFGSNTSSQTSSNNTNNGATSTLSKKIGNLNLTGDRINDLTIIRNAVRSQNLGGNTSQEIERSINQVLQNAKDSNTSLSDAETALLNEIVDDLLKQGITPNIDPDLFGHVMGTGKNADGGNLDLAKTACYNNPCSITSAKLLQNPQVLVLTLTNKTNSSSTNFSTKIKPKDTVPSFLKPFISIIPDPNGGNATVRILKAEMTANDLNNWCGIKEVADPNSVKPGGNACYQSPGTSSEVFDILLDFE